jgi:hypothetical protein
MLMLWKTEFFTRKNWFDMGEITNQTVQIARNIMASKILGVA